MDKIVKNIYLLRHEQRTDDPGFDTCLTEQGLLNSKCILDRLNKIDFVPTKIYVSPYIRCLQTAQDMCDRLDIKLMIENSLAEWFNPKDAVNRVTTPRKLSSKEIDKYNVDPYYMSFLNQDRFQEYESWNACINRTKEFLNFLDKKHGHNSDGSIIESPWFRC